MKLPMPFQGADGKPRSQVDEEKAVPYMGCREMDRCVFFVPSLGAILSLADRIVNVLCRVRVMPKQEI
jgi:hypothetical protein